MKQLLHDVLRIPLPAGIALLMLAGCGQDTLLVPETPSTESSAPMLAKMSETVSAAGDFTVTNLVPTAVVPDDNGCVIHLTATFEFVGSLVGAFTASFVIEHDGPCDKPAEETFEAEGIYEGDIAGVEGSFPLEFDGTIDADGDAQGILEMKAESVEAKLQLAGVAGVAGTYSGEIKLKE